LIRIAKRYNNEIFSENEIDAKVIVLLRDDISDVLSKKSADMGKVFSSYSVPLNWYEHSLFKHDENLIPLKKFINKRISHAFNEKGIELTNNDPWESLIDNGDYHESSFKYIIDHTFQSPRDLILFFQEASKYQFSIPLKFRDVNQLIGEYSKKIKSELENALSIYFSSDEIEDIFLCFKAVSSITTINFSNFEDFFSTRNFKYKTEKIVEILFEYSLVGNNYGNHVVFKHRDENNSCSIDFNKPFTLHRIIKVQAVNSRS
jgi:hypothetical protein